MYKFLITHKNTLQGKRFVNAENRTEACKMAKALGFKNASVIKVEKV